MELTTNTSAKKRSQSKLSTKKTNSNPEVVAAVADKEKDENDALLAKYDELKRREETLDREIEALIGRGVATDLEPQMRALHEYNEVKDLAQTVLGYLADAEHTAVAELHKRYKLPVD